MRLFLAIELSEQARKQLAALSQLWQDTWGERLLGKSPRPYPRCSWVRPQNLHVTLKFLGEVEESRVARVCLALEQVRMPGVLQLQPDRIELLPPRGPVRVIAVGLGGDIIPLKELHKSIQWECKAIGFPPEGRKYRPHVTLARARVPLHAVARPTLVEAASSHLPAAPMQAREFVLMESRLHRDAAEYIPLAHFGLESS